MYDKNHNRIYEGDILKRLDAEDYSMATGIPLDELAHCTGEIISVMYDAPQFCFANNTFGYLSSIATDLFEVIGNIHDNPELLNDPQNTNR